MRGRQSRHRFPSPRLKRQQHQMKATWLRATRRLARARWSAAQLLRSSDLAFIVPFVFMQPQQQPPRRCRAAIVWVPLLRRSETRWQTECQAALNSTTQSALNETRLLWKWCFARAWICNKSVSEASLSKQGRFAVAHCCCSVEAQHDSCYSSLIKKQRVQNGGNNKSQKSKVNTNI